MNYIFDTYLNFNKNLYEFYEWNQNDKIIHIKKIPTFRISNKDFINIKNNIIQINTTFIKDIYNKTETFKNSKIKYATIFSNGKEIIAIKFNKNGLNHMKSSLLIDEEDEIINIIKRQKETPLEYKIIKKNIIPTFKTRFEKENQKFIIDELNKIYQNNDSEKINYICLECFGKQEKNIESAITKLKKEIIKENDNFSKIFKIFKMIS